MVVGALGVGVGTAVCVAGTTFAGAGETIVAFAPGLVVFGALFFLSTLSASTAFSTTAADTIGPF